MPDRRTFIASALGIGAAGLVLGAAPAAAHVPSPTSPSRTKVKPAGAHAHYSLKFFRKGVGKRWRIGGMTVELERVHPIVIGDGSTTLHESAFGAVFDRVSGAKLPSGTYRTVAPNGDAFDLHVSRIHHSGREVRYQAIINRFVPVH